MTRLRRVIYAFRFIRDRARVSPAAMERTQSRFVANTYGIETALVKRIKARFRNELSFSGEGKRHAHIRHGAKPKRPRRSSLAVAA